MFLHLYIFSSDQSTSISKTMHDHNYSKFSFVGSSDFDIRDNSSQTEQVTGVSTETQVSIQTSDSNIQCQPHTSSQSTQTDLTGNMIDELVQDNNNMKAKLSDKDTLRRELFVEKILSSDASVRKYTGLPNKQALDTLEHIVESREEKLKYWQGPRSSKPTRYQTDSTVAYVCL